MDDSELFTYQNENLRNYQSFCCDPRNRYTDDLIFFKETNMESINTHWRADNENNDSKPKQRENWSSHIEFLLTCIGFSTGINSMWNYPIISAHYGNSSFIFPYIFFSVVLGIPFVTLDITIGQFFKQTAPTAYRVVPLFRGIGWCTFMLLIAMNATSCRLMTQAMYMFLFCYKVPLPWVSCRNYLNGIPCITPQEILDHKNANITDNSFVFPPQEFWIKHFGHVHDDIHPLYVDDSLAMPNWVVIACLAFCTFIIGLSITFGLKVSAKVFYVSATLPFITMFLLLLISATLQGGIDGVRIYVYPNWNNLIQKEVWTETLKHMFISLKIGCGVYSALSSYNCFTCNPLSDATLIVIIDSSVSFLAGFIIYSILGHMSFLTGYSNDEIVKMNKHYMFSTLLTSVITSRFVNIWSVVILFTFLCLSFNFQVTVCETLTLTILDCFTLLQHRWWGRPLVVLLLSVVFFHTNFFMLTNSGHYFSDAINDHVLVFAISTILILQCIVIGGIYNYQEFLRDLSMIINRQPRVFVFVSWFIMAPFLICPMLFVSGYFLLDTTMNNLLPWWIQLLSWMLLVLILPMPLGVCAVYELYQVRYRLHPGVVNNWHQRVWATLMQPLELGPGQPGDWIRSRFYITRLEKIYPTHRLTRRVRDRTSSYFETETETQSSTIGSLFKFSMKKRPTSSFSPSYPP